MNLGIGLGGLVGGLIATTSDPGSFTRLFLLDAATFLVFVRRAGRVPSRAATAEAQEEPAATGRLPRPQLRRALGLNVLFVAVGYEVFALLPPFAKNYAAWTSAGSASSGSRTRC
jgi:hypothetical protein